MRPLSQLTFVRLGAQGERGNLFLLPPLLVCVVMTVFSVLCQHGGFLHPEIEGRLPYYVAGGSLWSKLYDSDFLDGGMYQARELSYLFDYIDCRFIALCVALGHPHFLSLTFYVCLTLIGLMLWRCGVEELKLERWIVLCVLMMLWTTPAVFLGGTFFRTAKIGVALAVVVLYGRIFRILRAARGNPGHGLSARLWLGCFGWAWAATLFDRQGVFMVGLAVFFLAFWFLGYREKTTLKLMGAFAAALALSVIYNYVIAPLLTLSINDYWPDFKYQHLPWSDLLDKPFFYLGEGASLYIDTVRFFLGNIPAWGAVVVVAGLGFGALVPAPARQEGKAPVPGALGLFMSQTVLIWIMLTLMVLRHGGLRWPDVRRVYYFLPAVSMFAMTLLLALALLATARRLPKWCLALLLGGALLGNIIALARHDAILRNGSLKAEFQSTPALLHALRNLRNPQYPVSPELARNRVFQYFHDGHFSKTPPVLPRDKDKTAPKK
jgi:hypothetical protein